MSLNYITPGAHRARRPRRPRGAYEHVPSKPWSAWTRSQLLWWHSSSYEWCHIAWMPPYAGPYSGRTSHTIELLRLTYQHFYSMDGQLPLFLCNHTHAVNMHCMLPRLDELLFTRMGVEYMYLLYSTRLTDHYAWLCTTNLITRAHTNTTHTHVHTAGSHWKTSGTISIFRHKIWKAL